MKRLIQLVAQIYPRAWRAEFGDEFDALLDDVQPRWRTLFNVLTGAITMRIAARSNALKVAATTTILAALIATGLSYIAKPTYTSSAIVTITPKPDPVRPTDPQTLRRRAADRVAEMESAVLSRGTLTMIINDPGLQLYKKELKVTPLEDVIEQMRRNIHIQPMPSAADAITFTVAFSYLDQAKAQATLRRLTDEFTDDNANLVTTLQSAYRDFWTDLRASEGSATPILPAPTVQTLEVSNTTNPPTTAQPPNRAVYLASGLAIGVLLSLLVILTMSSPRTARKWIGYAIPACVLAALACQVFPFNYESSAIMQIYPAILNEDPLAYPPPATSAVDFLRQYKPRLASPAGVRIEPKPGSVSAFTITYASSEPAETKHAVQQVVNAMNDLYANDARAKLPHLSKPASQIQQRGGAERLEILEEPSIPTRPYTPYAVFVQAAILLTLVFAHLTLYLRRGKPTPPFATLTPARQ